MRIRLIALTALALIILPASSALAAGPGGIGIRLVDVPADSRDDPFARSYIVDSMAPGTSSHRRLEIVNSTRSTVSVAVYSAAADQRRGTFEFAPGHSQNDLSNWTSVSRGALRLPPGAKGFETVTINVPEEASSGERYAVVWAEVSAPASGGVTLVNRVGVRMYLSIGPGGTRPPNFAIGPLNAKRSETGAPLVVAMIHNTGARTLDLSGNLTLDTGPGGLRAGPFPITLVLALAPDDSQSVTVQLDKRFPRGPWHAHFRLQSGSVHRTANATITFPALVGGAPPAEVAESRPLIVVLIVILLALLAAAALAFLFSRRDGSGRGDVGPAAIVYD